MNVRLDHIQDWWKLGEEVHWSVAALAKRAGASVRALERFFLQNMGKSPKAWLLEQRHRHAMDLLNHGCSVKETAAQLGYQYAHHFSREFKAYWGSCPSTHAASNKSGAGHCRILV
jgi:transcriptional regulator GlxA family with amidase domain